MNKHIFRFLATKSTKKQWLITEQEHHHLTKVLRLKQGDCIEVFDGCGSWANAKIEELNTHGCIARSDQDYFEEPTAHKKSILLGALDFKVLDNILPMIVELGLDALYLFNNEGQPVDRLNSKSALRWQRLIIESCKQSKRPWLLQLSLFKDLRSALDILSQSYEAKLLLDKDGKQDFSALRHKSQNVLCLIGAENGLSSSQIELAKSYHFELASLGPNTLRSLTATVAISALMNL